MKCAQQTICVIDNVDTHPQMILLCDSQANLSLGVHIVTASNSSRSANHVAALPAMKILSESGIKSSKCAHGRSLSMMASCNSDDVPIIIWTDLVECRRLPPNVLWRLQLQLLRQACALCIPQEAVWEGGNRQRDVW
jgi:hypothetical protein